MLHCKKLRKENDVYSSRVPTVLVGSWKERRQRLPCSDPARYRTIHKLRRTVRRLCVLPPFVIICAPTFKGKRGIQRAKGTFISLFFFGAFDSLRRRQCYSTASLTTSLQLEYLYQQMTMDFGLCCTYNCKTMLFGQQQLKRK